MDIKSIAERIRRDILSTASRDTNKAPVKSCAVLSFDEAKAVVEHIERTTASQESTPNGTEGAAP